MASLEVTLERSSMSMAAKLNILTAEGCRRLRNCSLDTPWSIQVIFLNKLMISMMWGGYTPKVREVVARRILAKYTNDLHNNKIEGRKLYRTKTDRQSDLKSNKATWFRKLGATTTLRVPATKNSELAK